MRNTIRKKLYASIALSFVSVPLLASTENPCNLPLNPPPPVLYTDFSNNPNAQFCVPYPGLGITDTTSTLPHIVSNDGGMVAYWYCKQMAGFPPVWVGKWGFNIAAITNAELNKPGYLSSLGS